MPSSLTNPLEPNTWKLNPPPVAVIVAKYPDMPAFMRNSIEVVSSASTATARLKLWQYTSSISPPKVDHAVDRVHAHGGQAAAGSLVPARPPRIRRQVQRVGEGHIGFAVQDFTQLAGPDLFAQLGHFRVQAAVVTQAERHAGLFCRRHGPLGGRLAQGERLLAEHVLAGLGGRHHLVRVRPSGGVASTTASMFGSASASP